MRAHLRSLLPAFLVVAGAMAFLTYGSLAGPAHPPRIDQRRSIALASGIVQSITDGDTIRLADRRRVRLAQIDAPERAEGECYAEQATRTLVRLLPIGSVVLLQGDRALDETDRYGRLLAYVFKDKRSVNLQLVDAGAAAPYFQRGRRGRYAGQLLAAVRRAKARRLGLWGACPATRLDPSHAVDTHR